MDRFVRSFVVCLAFGATRAPGAELLDVLPLGEATIEKAHALAAQRSEVIRGGLELPARRLLPPETESWEGGRIGFTMKVDPEQPNCSAKESATFGPTGFAGGVDLISRKKVAAPVAVPPRSTVIFHPALN